MPDAPQRFLIVEADPFIALDLAESIRDCGPADLSMAATLDEACGLMAGSEPICAAFVRAPAALIDQSGLAALVAGAGGRIVLIGGSLAPDHVRARGWHQLEQPFTGESVYRVMLDLGCVRG